jgi:hypothetical protein
MHCSPMSMYSQANKDTPIPQTGISGCNHPICGLPPVLRLLHDALHGGGGSYKPVTDAVAVGIMANSWVLSGAPACILATIVSAGRRISRSDKSGATAWARVRADINRRATSSIGIACCMEDVSVHSEFKTLLPVRGVSGIILLSWIGDKSCCVDEPNEYPLLESNGRCCSCARVALLYHGAPGNILPAATIVWPGVTLIIAFPCSSVVGVIYLYLLFYPHISSIGKVLTSTTLLDRPEAFNASIGSLRTLEHLLCTKKAAKIARSTNAPSTPPTIGAVFVPCSCVAFESVVDCTIVAEGAPENPAEGLPRAGTDTPTEVVCRDCAEEPLPFNVDDAVLLGLFPLPQYSRRCRYLEQLSLWCCFHC